MNKPPAFQFYADDFLSGTADMTAEEVGVYIRLLCHAWNKDGLEDDDERLKRMAGECGGNAIAYAKSKFKLIDGRLKNERQEQEREKQLVYREKQAKNSQKRWVGNPTAFPPHIPPQCSPSPSPSPSPKREREDSTRPIFAEIPCWAEFWGYCQTQACLLPAEWYARDKFEAANADQWKNKSDWRAYARRCKGWWQADGRPMTPKTQNGPRNGKQQSKPVGGNF